MKGKDLQRKRKVLGMTQRQLARHLGVSSSSVSRWEAGIIPIPRWLEFQLTRDAKITLEAVTGGAA
jgi:transcriptional regulator with XRE-family HTH domain